jgi:hypothetical protein
MRSRTVMVQQDSRMHSSCRSQHSKLCQHKQRRSCLCRRQQSLRIGPGVGALALMASAPCSAPQHTGPNHTAPICTPYWSFWLSCLLLFLLPLSTPKPQPGVRGRAFTPATLWRFTSRACCPSLLSCLPASAAEWGIKLISSRDGVGEDGWQLRRLEPEDRQHLTVLQLAGAHGTGLARFTMRGLFHAAHDSTQQATFSS